MPDWTREIRGRLSTVRLSPAREAEVVEELNTHLEERWRELVAGGASADEATRTVRTELAASDMLARRISALRQARWVIPLHPPRRELFPSTVSKPTCARASGPFVRARASRSRPCWCSRSASAQARRSSRSSTPWSCAPCPSTSRSAGRRRRATQGAAGKAAPKGSEPANVDPARPGSPQPGSAAELHGLGGRQQVFESMAAISGQRAVTLREPGAEPEDLSRAARHGRRSSTCCAIRPAIGRIVHSENEVDGRHRRRRAERRLVARRFGARSRHRRHARSRSKAAATKWSASCLPASTYPVGAATGHRPLGPLRRPARTSARANRRLQLLPPDRRAAEAGRVAGAGAGADGPDRRGAARRAPRVEQGQR